MFSKLKELVSQYDNIYIFKHVRPDPDAMGSSWGLKQLIEDNFEGKNVQVVGSGKEHNITLFPQDEKPTLDSKNTLAIIVDTANNERVESELWRDCAASLKIDHHPVTDSFGDENIEIVDVSSCAQIIVMAAVDLEWKISKKAAGYLAAGIISDTGRFKYKGTDERTFMAMQTLMENDADILNIYKNLYKRSLKDVKAGAYVMLNFENRNGLGFIYMDNARMAEIGVDDNEVKKYLYAMADIEGVNVWCMAYDTDGQIKVSARSKERKINHVLEQFGGGGHELACAAMVDDVETMNKLREKLEEVANG